MSKIMVKMMAELAGITPDEIAATIANLQNVALNGVDLLESIDARLTRIESHLSIETGEKADAE